MNQTPNLYVPKHGSLFQPSCVPESPNSVNLSTSGSSVSSLVTQIQYFNTLIFGVWECDFPVSHAGEENRICFSKHVGS
jgi:hypothetical protein